MKRGALAPRSSNGDFMLRPMASSADVPEMRFLFFLSLFPYYYN